jgi:hypothetical protein
MEGRGIRAHCLICQGIDIESLAQASGYQHLSLGNLRRSREECRMCDFLCEALQDPWCLMGRSDTTDIWNNTWSFNMQLTDGLRPKLRLTVSAPTESPVIADLTAHTDEGDPAKWVGLLPRLPLPSSTSSHESYATARKWIGDCLSGHSHVPQSGEIEIRHPEVCHSDSNDRPRRLVNVQSRGTGLLLMLNDALSVSQPYATLSHCVRNMKPAILSH